MHLRLLAIRQKAFRVARYLSGQPPLSVGPVSSTSRNKLLYIPAQQSQPRREKQSTGNPVSEMEYLKNNPYYSKYAEKLKHLEEAEAEQFQSKLDELDSEKNKEKLRRKQENEEARLAAQAAQQKSEKLESVMKLELIADKTAEEITELWKTYHSDKDYIFAVLPAAEYEEIHRKSTEFPWFLYPLPRSEGYEFFVQQWSGHTCHFTPLIMYQTHQENAPPCLSLLHFTELVQDKGIVLMRGEPDTKVLSIHESQLLALQVKQYYGADSDTKFNHVRTFNNSPDSFHHRDVIREFESCKKDVKDKLENAAN